MKNKKEKVSDNRKALPKFLCILLLSMIAGGIFGFYSEYMKESVSPDLLVKNLHSFLKMIAPYAIWISLIVFSGSGWIAYNQARKMYISWDGEDEILISAAEQKVNWSLLFGNANLIISFFFFGLFRMLSVDKMIVMLIGFIVTLASVIVLQQKNVDLTRKINPEKEGSIYDMKFREKWLNSCDENEIRQIGQASYKAFIVTNYTCIGLWLVLFLLAGIIPIGILPSLVVLIIWAVLQVTYILECIQKSRF